MRIRWVIPGRPLMFTDDRPLPRQGDSAIGPAGERLQVSRIDHTPFSERHDAVVRLRPGGGPR
jgi:hypothetical protein